MSKSLSRASIDHFFYEDVLRIFAVYRRLYGPSGLILTACYDGALSSLLTLRTTVVLIIGCVREKIY